MVASPPVTKVSGEYSSPKHRSEFVFWALLTFVVAGIIAFSQLGAGLGDEGFHLLAAQLVLSGKKPYLDFFYQHTPLYIYVCAAWMRLFGDSWRAAHLLSAIFTAGSVVLVATYVFNRWKDKSGRVAVAVTTTLLLGFNFALITNGTLGQPYSFCLFFSVAAFRLAVKDFRDRNSLLPLLAGLCSGAAAASSLLTITVAPVILLWMLWHDKSGSRLLKTFRFSLGIVLAFAPMLLLFVRGPRQVFLDVFQYHLLYRDSAGRVVKIISNIKTVGRTLTDNPVPFLLLLVVLGWIPVLKSRVVSGRLKSEFNLCLWLLLIGAIYLCIPLPTFAVYFVVLLPFLIVLGAAGIHTLYDLSPRRFKSLIMLLVVLASINIRDLYGAVYWGHGNWQKYESAAELINRVTPAGASMFADEAVYFVTRHRPPLGLENAFATENLATDVASGAHVTSNSQVDTWLETAYFDTVVMRSGDPRVERFNLLGKYPKNQKIQLDGPAPYYVFSKQ